jgi:hypothetical protein
MSLKTYFRKRKVKKQINNYIADMKAKNKCYNSDVLIKPYSKKVTFAIEWNNFKNKVEINCWSADGKAKGDSVGDYIFPSEFDLFIRNMEAIMKGKYICSNCRKIVDDFDKTHWRMFASRLCEECEKSVPYEDYGALD